MFPVHYECAFYSQWAHLNLAPRDQGLWDAYKYCKAAKTLVINGYCTVPSLDGTTSATINQTSVQTARSRFGQFINHVMTQNWPGSFVLVPVPSKDSFNEDRFRSLAIVSDAVAAFGFAVLPSLRYNILLPRASEGGARGYNAVYPHIDVTQIVRGRTIILVDDVLTTGGSMLASRDRLVEAGASVPFGISCGKTVDTFEPPFAYRIHHA